MNAKLILASVIGAVVAFLLGWLIFGIILMGFYEANTMQYTGLMKEVPNLFLMIIGNFFMAFLLSFIFQRWAGFKTFMQGLNGGMLIGFCVGLSYDLFFIAMMNLYNTKVMVVDVLANTILMGIVGGVIALILGYEKKTA
jgi:hypothetical protein